MRFFPAILLGGRLAIRSKPNMCAFQVCSLRTSMVASSVTRSMVLRRVNCRSVLCGESLLSARSLLAPAILEHLRMPPATARAMSSGSNNKDEEVLVYINKSESHLKVRWKICIQTSADTIKRRKCFTSSSLFNVSVIERISSKKFRISCIQELMLLDGSEPLKTKFIPSKLGEVM